MKRGEGKREITFKRQELGKEKENVYNNTYKKENGKGKGQIFGKN